MRITERLKSLYEHESPAGQAELDVAAEELLAQLKANPTLITVINMRMPSFAQALREMIAE